MARYFSPSWHRVTELKPRLAEHLEIHRHRYRGKSWYVIDDRAAGRVHRFTPSAYQFIIRMDGQHTVEAIWQHMLLTLGDDAPGQEEVIQLLGQLHTNDLLKCDVVPDSAELFSRFDKQSRSLLFSNLKNPLSLRLPLWDPDAFLKRSLPWLKPFFSSIGLFIWLAVLITGIVVAGQHWDELTENMSDRMLAAHNLIILWLTFPVVKAIHELGHGYATRVNGGEVHEMGVMLLAFMLVPYVDASAAAGFRSKWQRFLVGAAGMMAELFLAGLALIIWSLIEPGFMRSLLFNVTMIAGVSTLLFNGNPLLRYDGYYMLSDLVEIPNLGTRANSYWGYLANRYLLGTKDLSPFDASPGERRWFLFYGPASFVYRFVVMIGISLFLASEFFIVGVLMALWSCISMVVFPIVKNLHYLLFNPKLNNNRWRANLASSALAGGLALVLLLVPMPLRTQSEGVLWLPKQAEVRAGSAGFVSQVLIPVGTQVEPGDPLILSRDSVLEAEMAVSRARVQEINARRNAEWIDDHVKAEITRDELVQEQAKLARAEERAGKLLIRSPARGRFVLANEKDLPGRFLKQGELVGFVVDGSTNLVRVVVPQEDIDLVRRSVRDVAVRFASHIDNVLPATIIREVPAARNELPSLALSTDGGGHYPIDPRTQSVWTVI